MKKKSGKPDETLESMLEELSRVIEETKARLNEISESIETKVDSYTIMSDSEEKQKLISDIEDLKQERAALENKLSRLVERRQTLTIVAMISGQVRGKISEYLPIVRIIINENKGIILSLFKDFCTLFDDTREDFVPQVERSCKVSAKFDKIRYDAYVEAGFNPENAMTLLLASKSQTMKLVNAVFSSALSGNMVKVTDSAKKRIRRNRGDSEDLSIL